MPGGALTAEEWHKKTAIDLFNQVWDLMEKEGRTREEDDAMVHAAHASRHHWAQVGEPVHLARGEWQISRVYAVLGRPHPSLYHGERCLEICQENGIGDFDLAYAYEAIARACAVGNDAAGREKHLELARRAAAEIAEDEDRDLVLKDLETIPVPE